MMPVFHGLSATILLCGGCKGAGWLVRQDEREVFDHDTSDRATNSETLEVVSEKTDVIIWEGKPGWTFVLAGGHCKAWSIKRKTEIESHVLLVFLLLLGFLSSDRWIAVCGRGVLDECMQPVAVSSRGPLEGKSTQMVTAAQWQDPLRRKCRSTWGKKPCLPRDRFPCGCPACVAKPGVPFTLLRLRA